MMSWSLEGSWRCWTFMLHSANVTLSNRTGPNGVAPHITAPTVPNKAAMLQTSTDACLNNTLGRQLGEEYSHKWEPRQGGSPGGPRESGCLQPCHAIIAIYYHFTPDYTSRMTTNLDTNGTAFFSGWLWGRGTSDAQINHICWYKAQVSFF